MTHSLFRVVLTAAAVSMIASACTEVRSEKNAEAAKPSPTVAPRTSTNAAAPIIEPAPTGTPVVMNMKGVPTPPPMPAGANVPTGRKIGKEMVDVNPSATPLPLVFRPAPENSRIAVAMQKDGSITEVREFKSDPVLLRVETKWTQPDKKAVRFTLRSGKTVDLVTGKVQNLATMSSAELARLAGAGK